ncbi:hypothetical protein FIBSPDRAFT_1050843 [Athelia psychrophila]|uniref:Ams2/SPT21 N-terminal domain-containing protein n=1 Tax=Athelia psychrophila TaxID=1759441 RepID=A0A166A2S9_9AGAM|nr:hypothetical protein FIBSPDRAFT_1050843 [Fibularhizoctonia sp. CBS 109695]
MDTRVLLPVRILYTINSSPQYILARAPAKVRCTPIAATAATHAQCSLKTCLATICRASPELVQDSARDFSVYVLDPLESAAPASSSTLLHTPGQSTSETGNADAGGSSHGVAVGLGLMSWALLAEEEEGEEACVTGTLVVGAGVQSLQVVFALRETTHMHKGNLSPALKSWSRPPSARAADTAPAHDLSTANNTTKPKLAPKPASSGSSRLHHTTISNTQHVHNRPDHTPIPRRPTTPPRPDMIPGSDPAYAIDLTASPSPQRPRASASASASASTSTSASSSLPFYSHSQSHGGTGPLTFRPLSRRRPLDAAYAPPYGIAGRPRAPGAPSAEQARLREKERLRSGKKALEGVEASLN